MRDRLAALTKEVEAFARARDWEQFHTPKNLAMALSVEAAELTEIFQWLTAEQSARLGAARRAHLADELADVFIYLLKLARHYRIDLIDAGHAKMRKNARKYPASKARGSMKKYTEL